MQSLEIQKSPQKISEVMNELSLYIMFALGFMLFRYISELLFKLLSNLLFPLFYDVTQSHSKAEDSDRSDNGSSSLENYFREYGFWKLTGAVHTYNTYIKSKGLVKNETPFTILEEMKEHDITPDISTYNTLIYLCLKENKANYAFDLFNQCCQNDSEVKPDIVTFNTYVKGLVMLREKGDKKIALDCIPKILKDISKFKLKANDITYNTVINLCVSLGGIKEAWEYFLEMQSKGIEPDLFTYSILVKGLKDQPLIYRDSFDKLYKSIEEYIQRAGDNLDEVLFNTLVDTAVAYKDFDRINKILELMKVHQIQFSNITYGILIKAFGQNGMIENAIAIFEQMRKYHVQPNEITYGCIIDGCIRANMYDKVMELLDQMSEENIQPNIVIYCTLLKGYTKQKDFRKIWELYKMIAMERKVAPNIVFYNALLESLNQCQKQDLLIEIYNQILKENPDNIRPDIITYSTLIKGLCKAHHMDTVMAIYKKVKNERVIVLDEVMHNSIMHGLLEEGRYNDCECIYEQMQGQGIRPSEVTYTILIKLYTRTGQFHKTVALYDEVQRQQGRMGVIFGTCVLQACIKSKQIKKAIEVFELLRKLSRAKLDKVIYNTIVNGCVYMGRLDNAYLYTLWAMEDKIVMAANIYSNLLNNLLSSRSITAKEKRERLKNVLEYLKTWKLKIEDELYAKVNRFMHDNHGNANKLRTGYHYNH